MALVCDKRESVGIALFHDANDSQADVENIRMFGTSLLDRFEQDLLPALTALKPKFDKFEDEPSVRFMLLL